MLSKEGWNVSAASPGAGVAVFISSKGRAGELGRTLESVRRQSLQPVQIVLSVTDEKDLPENARERFQATVCIGSAGKTAQQNRGLNLVLPEADVVAFLDDDVELARDYLKTVHEAFLRDPELVGLSGHVVVNGGLCREEALAVVERLDALTGGNALPARPPQVVYNAAHQGLYGCCMSLRRRVFDHIRFDERLPLYSWLEDADIGIRAQRHGRCGYCADAWLVHLAIVTGRVSGFKFGFSQIMNPVYLATVGVLRWTEVLRIHVLKVLLANVVGVLRFDRRVDRWGRLRGNWLAMRLWAKGKIEPERIMSLEDWPGGEKML